MASLKAKLRAVTDEAKTLSEKRMTVAETKRLNDLMAYGKTLMGLIQQENAIDGATSRISAVVAGGVGDETEDGFAAGVGRITGGALKSVWEAACKGGSIQSGNYRVPGVRMKDVDGGGLITPAFRDPEEYVFPTKPTLLTAIVPAKVIGDGVGEGTNDFSYLRQKTRTNLAAVVADGGTKPMSIYAFEEKSDTLDTIAHISEPIKNRLIQDKANLSTWLYGEMAFGLDLAVESELVAAILADGDVQSQTFVTDFLTTSRKALTKMQAKYVVPDFLAVSLEDAEALDLTSDGMQRFYFAGPKESGSSPLWSVPVIANDAMPVGTAVLGSARAALRRYVNGQAQWALDTMSGFDVNTTRSRLEQRSKSVVTRPFGIVVIETGLGS